MTEKSPPEAMGTSPEGTPLTQASSRPSTSVRPRTSALPSPRGVVLVISSSGPSSAFAGAPSLIAKTRVPLQALRNLPAPIRAAHGDRFERFHRRLRSAERGGLRLVTSTRGEEQLYRVERGHEEPADASAPEAEAAELRDALARFAAEDRGPPPPEDVPAELARRAAGSFGELDPETADQLRTLGYLEPESAPDTR